ncbi:hypothetical protein DUNSADRAFT_9708, partial [Dunaliella salina]
TKTRLWESAWWMRSLSTVNCGFESSGRDIQARATPGSRLRTFSLFPCFGSGRTQSVSAVKASGTWRTLLWYQSLCLMHNQTRLVLFNFVQLAAVMPTC